jgi:DNA polymerase-3 subunit epsilon
MPNFPLEIKKYKNDINNINILNIHLPPLYTRYIVIDTKTTGPNPKENNIIEIACIEVIDGKISGEEFHAFLQPRYKMNEFSEKKTKLTDNFYKEYFTDVYLSDKNVLENFKHFVGNSLIFAHNANTEMEFINNELTYWKIPIIPKRKFLCTLKIFKEIFPFLSRNICSLKKCCEYLDLKPPSDNFHSAIFDSFMTARMVCRFFEIGNELREREEIKNKENKIENLKLENHKNGKNGNLYFDDIDKDYNSIMRNAGLSEIFINENYESNKENKIIIVEKDFDKNNSEENKNENNIDENKSNLRKLDEPVELKAHEIDDLINEI